jgi:hypothetical protein
LFIRIFDCYKQNGYWKKIKISNTNGYFHFLFKCVLLIVYLVNQYVTSKDHRGCLKDGLLYHLLNHHISNIELQSYEQLQNHPTPISGYNFFNWHI